MLFHGAGKCLLRPPDSQGKHCVSAATVPDARCQVAVPLGSFVRDFTEASPSCTVMPGGGGCCFLSLDSKMAGTSGRDSSPACGQAGPPPEMPLLCTRPLPPALGCPLLTRVLILLRPPLETFPDPALTPRRFPCPRPDPHKPLCVFLSSPSACRLKRLSSRGPCGRKPRLAHLRIPSARSSWHEVGAR